MTNTNVPIDTSQGNSTAESNVELQSMNKDNLEGTRTQDRKRKLNFDSPSTKDNIPTVEETSDPKRSKDDEQSISTIAGIREGSFSNVFEGDILSLYGPALSKDTSGSPKVPIVHADLVDKHGQLTITVNFNNNLIPKFLPLFSVGTGVRITDFLLKPKGTFERGDIQYCIQLTPKSIVQNIASVCHELRLAPDCTINALIASNLHFVVGSVAAIVTRCDKIRNQFELDIKDGETKNDTALLQLNETFQDFCLKAQQQLAAAIFPTYLFKNIVRNGPKACRVFRSGISTSVYTLKDKGAQEELQSFIQSSGKVQGTLRVKSAYASPFAPFCSTCHQLISVPSFQLNESWYCTKCQKDTVLFYDHVLYCTIEKGDKDIHCILQKPLLEKTFPELTGISYEAYKKDISLTLKFLRTFKRTGSFTLTMDNFITEIQLQK